MIFNNNNDDSPAIHLLQILKRTGGMTIKEIEKEMGVTKNAVRVQLGKLMTEGMVESRREKQGRGRPHLIFTLTERALKVFPRNYVELLNVLLEKVLRQDAPSEKQTILNYLIEKMSERFGEQIKGDSPSERLHELVTLLKDRGIMAELVEQEPGIALREFNCPYNEIARLYPEICGIEKEMISKVLHSPVQLNNCMMNGNTYCQFQIMPFDNSLLNKKKNSEPVI